MVHKALLGIEYTAIMGIFLLLLTFASSTSLTEGQLGGGGGPPTSPGDGDGHGGDGGEGEDEGDDVGGGAGDPAEPLPGNTGGGEGGTVDSNALGGVRFEGSGTEDAGTPLTVTIFTISTPEGEERRTRITSGNRNYRDTILIPKTTPEDGTIETDFTTKGRRSARLSFNVEKDVVNIKITVEEASAQDKARVDIRRRQDSDENKDRTVLDYFRLDVEGDDIVNEKLKVFLPTSLTDNKVDFSIFILNDDGTRVNFITTTTPITAGTVAVEANIKPNSLFVIDARNIVKGPNLCNNDNVCDFPAESVGTCPSDCFPPTVDYNECEPGSYQCIGDMLYQCQPNGEDLLNLETCDLGCSRGACLTEASAPGTSSIFIIMVLIVVVLGLAVATTFMRR